MGARSDRLVLFDAMRAVAVLSVVLFHGLYQIAVAARHGEGWWPLGVHLDVGAPIFFGISGFLLYRPFLLARTGSRPVSLRAYGWRRVVRIVPAYWVALTVVAIWLGLHEVRDEPLRFFGFGQVYSSSTALSGIGQAWTLCVEVAFYLFLPAWALAMRSLSRRFGASLLKPELAGLAAIILFATVWNVVALGSVDPASRDSLSLLLPFPGNVDHLAIGMLLALVSVWAVQEQGDGPRGARAFLDRVPGGLWWAGALMFWLLACFVAGPDGSPSDPLTDRAYFLRHVFYGGVILCILAPAVFGDARQGLLRRALGWRPLLWIGLISYSIYLYHLAVVAQVIDWTGAPGSTMEWIAYTVGVVSLSIAAGAIGYYVVERPALKLRALVPSGARVPVADDAAAPTALPEPKPAASPSS